MPRPRVHSDESLLEAARAEFAASGYSAASMDDIAASAGTTKPTLYARFGGKSELYEISVRERAQALLNHLFASYEGAGELPVADMINAATRSYFDFFAEHPEDFDLLFAPDRSRPATDLADEILDRIIGGITGLVERVLQRSGRVAPHQARLIAAMMVGVAHHALRQATHDEGIDRDNAVRLATSFVDAAVRGLDATLVG